MDFPIENGGSFHSFFCNFTRPGQFINVTSSAWSIWANYNNSLTWIKAIKGDDFPQSNYDFQGSLVVSSL